MTNDGIDRLQDLFARVIELPIEERDDWLAAECEDDQPLVEKVKALLAKDQLVIDPLEEGLGSVSPEIQAKVRQASLTTLKTSCPHCKDSIELLDDVEVSKLVCPSCGSSFSLVDDAHPTETPTEKVVGKYELIEHVGFGQSGSVWKARDTELNRIVALKIPRRGRLNESQTKLFLRDARAAAQLKHPNIVRVFEVGSFEGTIYIASDFVEGRTLRDRAKSERISFRSTAFIFQKIADALHHAHESHVIHRDLKPENIMLDSNEIPYVVDFGLAKLEVDEVTMTVEGHILGTPAYMPPEQARGESHEVDRRADIYSLGIVLYELLTGELPFRGDIQNIVNQILNDEPTRPRRLNSHIPRDLETICLKCLQKSPARRFSTAEAVAEELRLFLEHKPIRTRPVGRLAKAWRWCQREPFIASLACMLFLALAVGTTISAVYASSANLQATKAKRLADAEKIARLQATSEKERFRQTLYRSDMYLAGEAYTSQRFPRLLELLERHVPGPGEEDLRQWEWHVLSNLANLHIAELNALVGKADQFRISPDGSLLAAFGNDVTIHILDLQTRELVTTLVPPEGSTEVTSLAWTPDSQRIIAGHYYTGACLRIWDINQSKIIETIPQSKSTITSIACSPDGQWISWGTRSKRLFLSNRSESTPEVYSLPVRAEARAIRFSKDNLRLAVVGRQDRALHVLDLNDRKILKTFRLEQGQFIGADFDDADSLLICVDDPNDQSHVLIEDLSNRSNAIQWPTTPTRLSGSVTSFAVSPSRQRIAVGYWHGEIQLYDLQAGKLLGYLPGHASTIRSIAFSADETELISSAEEGSVKVWDLSESCQPSFPWGPAHQLPHQLSIAKRSGRIAAVQEGNIVVFDSTNHQQAFKVWTDVPNAVCVDWSSDEERLAVSGLDGSVQVFDSNDGALDLRLESDQAGQQYVARFSPDGKLIAAGGQAGFVDIWNEKGELQCQLDNGKGSRIHDMLFLEDSNTLVVSSADSMIRFWDVRKKQLTKSLEGHTGYNVSLALSQSGKWLISSSWDRTVRIWDLQSGDCKRTLSCSRFGIKDVAISNDERLIAVADNKGGVIIIDVVSGEPLVNLEMASYTIGVEFSPDGRTLYSAHTDGLVRIWNAGPAYADLN